MGEPATTAPGPANPIEERTCRKCTNTKPVSPDTWIYKKGRQGFYKAHGQICLACEKSRKVEYESRRDKIAASIATLTAAPSDLKGQPADKHKVVKEAGKLDAALAFKSGSKVLNEYAPAVMARVLEYLEDTSSEHHIWALEFLAQRILPRKLYEELGGQAAGVGSLNDKRPQVVLNILPSSASEPQGRVIDAETVEVIPVQQQIT